MNWAKVSDNASPTFAALVPGGMVLLVRRYGDSSDNALVFVPAASAAPSMGELNEWIARNTVRG